MRPHPGYESETADSMQRFAEVARRQPGCVLCSTFRDEESGDLRGIAVWESEQAAQTAGPELMAAVADDDFETWVAEMDNHRLSEL
jgi:quinol monooxygenase YgiN